MEIRYHIRNWNTGEQWIRNRDGTVGPIAWESEEEAVAFLDNWDRNYSAEFEIIKTYMTDQMET